MNPFVMTNSEDVVGWILTIAWFGSIKTLLKEKLPSAGLNTADRCGLEGLGAEHGSEPGSSDERNFTSKLKPPEKL